MFPCRWWLEITNVYFFKPQFCFSLLGFWQIYSKCEPVSMHEYDVHVQLLKCVCVGGGAGTQKYLLLLIFEKSEISKSLCPFLCTRQTKMCTVLTISPGQISLLRNMFINFCSTLASRILKTFFFPCQKWVEVLPIATKKQRETKFCLWWVEQC